MKKNEIVKSPVILQKEKELKALQKKKDKIVVQLKKNKIILAELQEKVVATGKYVQNSLFRMLDIAAIIKEIKELFLVLKKSKISKREKRDLDTLYQVAIENGDGGMAADMFGDVETPDLEEMARKAAEERTDEFNRSRAAEMFSQFRVAPDKEEQQNIRKVFIKLAGQFHPDKAKDPKEAALFHQLMQRINAAYEYGDIGELLEIQAQYADYEQNKPDITEASAVLDFLDQEIAQLQRNIESLTQQLERIKAELQQIKKSEVGRMLKHEDIEEQKTSEEATMVLSELYVLLHDTLKIYAETGKKPAVFDSLLDGTHPIFEKMHPDDDLFEDDDEDETSEEEILDFLDIIFANAKSDPMTTKVKVSSPRSKRRKK